MENQTEPSIVYLLQEPTTARDLSSAVKYGKVVQILSAKDKPYQDPEGCMRKLQTTLRNFNPYNDYLCYAGSDPLVQFLTGIIMERMEIGEVKQLLWNRERDEKGATTGRGYYLPKTITIWPQEEK